MKLAADFRREAREALRGKWPMAILIGLVAALLLVVPGIIMGYTYGMTDYILAEYPEMEPGEVLRTSKAMMTGNRWRLFCLQFSFIGWSLLCSLTFGLGNLALRPYREAAYAAFYREVSLA